MILLRIKGNTEQAKKAALDRGILIEVEPGECTCGFPGHCAVYAKTEENDMAKVVEWYCETTTSEQGKGFAAGTLLYYC